jgi:hypothetical protein
MDYGERRTAARGRQPYRGAHRRLKLLNIMQRDVCVSERVMIIYGPACIVEPRDRQDSGLSVRIPRHE